MAVLELAMLSPTAKLCLESTIRCGGLVVGRHGYVGRDGYACRKCYFGRECECGQFFTAAPVWQLMALRLVRCAPGDDRVVEATDLGIELNDYGVVEIKNPPEGLALIDSDADRGEDTP